MQYKTIALELIHEEPELYERLRSSKRLLPAMDDYAIRLKQRHERWMETLTQTMPTSDLIQLASQAMEMAVEELRERLRSDSQTSQSGHLSLDAAMSATNQPMPPA